MPEAKSTSNYVLYLLVLGVAIVLVLVAQKNMSNELRLPPPGEGFVGKVPMVPIGNGRPYGPMQILPVNPNHKMYSHKDNQ